MGFRIFPGRSVSGLRLRRAKLIPRRDLQSRFKAVERGSRGQPEPAGAAR
jgi:hypothetical protein